MYCGRSLMYVDRERRPGAMAIAGAHEPCNHQSEQALAQSAEFLLVLGIKPYRLYISRHDGIVYGLHYESERPSRV